MDNLIVDLSKLGVLNIEVDLLAILTVYYFQYSITVYYENFIIADEAPLVYQLKLMQLLGSSQLEDRNLCVLRVCHDDTLIVLCQVNQVALAVKMNIHGVYSSVVKHHLVV